MQKNTSRVAYIYMIYRKRGIYSAKKNHLQVQLALKLKRFQSFRSQVALILGWRLVIRAISS